MKQSNSNDLVPDTSVLEAEVAVQSSLSRFETAMEHLAEKVQGTSTKIHRAQSIAQAPKRALMKVEDRILEALRPVGPFVSNSRAVSLKAIENVKANPKPLAFIAAGVAASILLYRYLDRNNKFVAYPNETFVPDEPGMNDDLNSRLNNHFRGNSEYELESRELGY